MTDVDTLVKTTLEKLGYPVERLIYTGKAETFITYQIVVGLDTHFVESRRRRGVLDVRREYLFPSV